MGTISVSSNCHYIAIMLKILGLVFQSGRNWPGGAILVSNVSLKTTFILMEDNPAGQGVGFGYGPKYNNDFEYIRKRIHRIWVPSALLLHRNAQAWRFRQHEYDDLCSKIMKIREDVSSNTGGTLDSELGSKRSSHPKELIRELNGLIAGFIRLQDEMNQYDPIRRILSGGRWSAEWIFRAHLMRQYQLSESEVDDLMSIEEEEGYETWFETEVSQEDQDNLRERVRKRLKELDGLTQTVVKPNSES